MKSMENNEGRVMVLGPSELRQAIRRRKGDRWSLSCRAAEKLIMQQYDLRRKAAVTETKLAIVGEKTEAAKSSDGSDCPRCHGRGIFYDADNDSWFRCDHKRLPSGAWFDGQEVPKLAQQPGGAREEFESRLYADKAQRGDKLTWDERGAWELYHCGWEDGVKHWVAVQSAIDGQEVPKLAQETSEDSLLELVTQLAAIFATDQNGKAIHPDCVGRVWHPDCVGRVWTLLASARSNEKRLREALNWTTHLLCGVGKRGESPEEGEIEAAVKEARAALAQSEPKEAAH